MPCCTAISPKRPPSRRMRLVDEIALRAREALLAQKDCAEAELLVVRAGVDQRAFVEEDVRLPAAARQRQRAALSRTARNVSTSGSLNAARLPCRTSLIRGRHRLGPLRRAGPPGAPVPHEAVSLELAATPDAAAVLRPEPIRFISYPYEWCFGQLARRGAPHARHPGARPRPGHHPARRQRLQRPVPRRAARSSSTRSPSSRGRKARPGPRTGSSASTSWCRSRS